MTGSDDSESSSGAREGDDSKQKLPLSFWYLFGSQLVSLLGTDIAIFAIRVWSYQTSESISQYTLITFFAEFPSLVLTPITGAVVDRYDRKTVIIVADSIAAVTSAAQALAFLNGSLSLTKVYAANAVASVCNSFQWPAFISTTTLLVPDEQRTKTGGLLEAIPALSMLLAPMIAGQILELGSLKVVFAIEGVTFLASAVILLQTKLPSVRVEAGEEEEGMKSAEDVVRQLLKDSAVAFDFIMDNPGVVALMVFLMVGMLTSSAIQLLTAPLILNFSTPAILGRVLTVSGLGALVGSGLLSMVEVNDRVLGLIVVAIFQGVLLGVCGLVPSSLLIMTMAFFYMATVPFSRVYRQALLQAKVPAEMQGRVFAVNNAIKKSALPVAALVAGPIAELLEPLFANENSPLAKLGIGYGPGRGVAFLFVLFGVMNVSLAVSALFYKPLRGLETHPSARQEKAKTS